MSGKALVLGGGGLTGIGWEWGILSGLAAAGVDLSTADLVVGTSAGSVVGAQVATGVDFAERYAAQLRQPAGEVAARMGAFTLGRYGMTILRARNDPQRARAMIGRIALKARTVPEAERRAIIAARLPVQTWPERRLLITAVDAHSGEFVTFDRDSGVPLVDAVAASCAVPGVWPAVTIDGRRYIDGGMRSAANVDLAADYDRVVVLAPITTGYGPIAGVQKQVSELTGRVHVISPDAAARRTFGRNVLDPARRAPAARAGRVQAQHPAMAEAVTSVWTG
jgi:NTE family protein